MTVATGTEAQLRAFPAANLGVIGRSWAVTAPTRISSDHAKGAP